MSYSRDLSAPRATEPQPLRPQTPEPIQAPAEHDECDAVQPDVEGDHPRRPQQIGGSDEPRPPWLRHSAREDPTDERKCEGGFVAPRPGPGGQTDQTRGGRCLD